MKNENQPLLPAQERQSIKDHRRQMGLQVWLPLAVTLLLFLALGAGVIYMGVSGSDNLYRFTDLSVIMMTIPVALVCLVGLAILAALVFLTGRLLKLLPSYTLLAQAYANYISVMARVASDKIVRPVFAIRKFVTGARTVRREVGRQQ